VRATHSVCLGGIVMCNRLKKLAGTLAALTSALALTGCVPVLTFTDYRPTMEGARLKEGYCIKNYRAEYAIEGVTLSTAVELRRNRTNTPVFFLSFAVPEGKSVLLTGTVLTVTPLSADERKAIGEAVKIDIPPMATSRGYSLGTHELKLPMEGRSTVSGNDTRKAEYWSTMLLADLPDGAYRVVLPDLNINGVIVKVPEVTFTRTLRAQFMTPINC
jgi:hypothetical protein